MSVVYVKLDDESQVVVSVVQGAVPFDPETIFEQGLICVEGHSVDFLQSAHIFTDELGFEFFARPSLPELVAIEGGWGISGLPEGTVCTITDISDGGTIHSSTGTELEFSLPDGGSYQIEFATAGLYMDRTYVLEVNSA
ncbi:hypothetical protein AB9F26_05210 [Falsihalocynthiibacter sp. BN13B15]|uniref:hypothetical protein n=1 Tax=Falsihalocynthiibacter sp. BN13B15 TaxID=3240871 RepID=UPI00351048F0